MFAELTNRYVLHPEWIRSKLDRDIHFISAEKLARLYGIPYYMCIRGDSPKYIEEEADVHLYPRYDGDYNVYRINPKNG